MNLFTIILVWFLTRCFQGFQGSARCTPFEVEVVAQELQHRNEALKQLQYHLERAQGQMDEFANRKHSPSVVKEGDLVYLKIRPHRQAYMPTRLHPKLSAWYYGPFQVTKQIGQIAFRLQLPESACIHLVFHVSQLKLAVGTHQVERELPEDLQGGGLVCSPLKMLERRTIQLHGETMP